MRQTAPPGIALHSYLVPDVPPPGDLCRELVASLCAEAMAHEPAQDNDEGQADADAGAHADLPVALLLAVEVGVKGLHVAHKLLGPARVHEELVRQRGRALPFGASGVWLADAQVVAHVVRGRDGLAGADVGVLRREAHQDVQRVELE
ncbi:hypothetical protein PpBr36_08939 [Pyricularia pennisetigena]|uniref:hypothetical protein n=1 Tax=Pyricularia pennisetigena TaxID=1578925 RepID=UPI00114E0B86|nr:hypothetical protein PpBr36_08939 [Pyricularia pennisetigena]TLS24569.1 hypothetical protein PpBr36_08939 [Pyricularia pennisetigena]